MYLNGYKTIKLTFLALLISATSLLNGCGDTSKPEQTINKPGTQKDISASITSKIGAFVSPSQTKDNKTENKPATTELFFTENYQGDASKRIKSFDCHQKIYAVIKLNSYAEGVHQIDVEWKDPFDKIRERTTSQLYVADVAGEQTLSWSALTLKAATGANLLAWANPAAGMEEFLGEWVVKVFIDKEFKVEKKLSVYC